MNERERERERDRTSTEVNLGLSCIFERSTWGLAKNKKVNLGLRTKQVGQVGA